MMRMMDPFVCYAYINIFFVGTVSGTLMGLYRAVDRPKAASMPPSALFLPQMAVTGSNIAAFIAAFT